MATQIPHAVGLAYAAQYRGDDAVVMAYCGDGATSEGDFHEALNFAGVWHVPVVFVVPEQPVGDLGPAQEADALRGPSPRRRSPTASRASRWTATTCSRSTRRAARRWSARARGDGPTLIECVTYRLGVHTTADDPTKYRSSEEVEAWERKDPLTRFGAYLQKQNLLDDGPRGAGRRRDRRARCKRFEAAGPPDPLAMFDHAYADAARRTRGPARRDGAPGCATARPRAGARDRPASPPMRGQRTSRR